MDEEQQKTVQNMKTVLVAINAKYEHEGLAAWCLKAACDRRSIPVTVQQHAINDAYQKIWAAIMDAQPDVVAFSCYIWNRPMVEKLTSDIKKATPSVTVVIGGPETGYKGSEAEYKQFGADYIMKGPGEALFPDFLEALTKRDVEQLRKLESGEVCREEDGYISPFSPEYLSRISGRIAYIESSRGCPYHCSYCLSSESHGFFCYPVEEIKEDLADLVKAGARVVKFVDSSFNANREHARAIWEYIREFRGLGTTFHFEINPDTLSPDLISLLAQMPRGLMQVEAGIQSTNPKTLNAVSRIMDVDKALENLRRIILTGNIHVHVDLIAGLPYEDLGTFKTSFNRVYDLKAHQLQLGFLKLLHGTRIRREADKHGYRYRDYPPYEVIANQYMGPSELLVLKGIEELVDRFYNSGRFTLCLDYLIRCFDSAYDFYEKLALWEKEQGILYQSASPANLYRQLMAFAQIMQLPINQEAFATLMALDYICSMRSTVLPDWLTGQSGLKLEDYRDYFPVSELEGVGKSEARKRFIVLEGMLPAKKGDDLIYLRNKIRIDTKQVDPVTGRAVPSFI